MKSPCSARLKIAVIVSLCSSLAAHDLNAQGGGGASRGGAANTVEGTGRGAGGPGDGQGPGQGAGQGLGPGGRDKDRAEKDRAEREKQKRERDEKERAEKARADKERADLVRSEKEKAEKERSERERQEKERLEKEKAERERADREKEQRERGEKERLEREKKESAERERAEKEREEKERADRERQQKETAEKERAEKERSERERQEKERLEKEKAERERADREKEQRERGEKERLEREKKESAERERAEKERVEKEREEKERADRERQQKESADKEREEKEKEESDPPGTDQGDDDKRPGQPGEERKEGGANDPGQTADQTKSGDETPRREEERPRESLERTGDDKPLRRDPAGERLVPESPARELVPGADNIPGAADAERALRSVTDPIAARDGFFGFLFGGRRAAPAEDASVSLGKGVVAAERSSRVRRPRGAFLGMFRLEVPDLLSAAKIRRVEIDPRVTSPRTLTYKSRVSRVSRWVGPLTLGLLNYVPFESMNAAVSGRMNNLMAEEKISVEETAARVFAENLAEGKRFAIGSPPEAMVELEVTRYALDPVPTSIGRMKPTVSLTGRLYSPTGRLLWVGKGFSTIAERGIKGATVEQYEENPAALRSDFEEAVRVASRRLAMQANALPRAKVTVVPQQRE